MKKVISYLSDLFMLPVRARRIIDFEKASHRKLDLLLKRAAHLDKKIQHSDGHSGIAGRGHGAGLFHSPDGIDPLPRPLMNTQAIFIGNDTVLARNAFGQKMYLPATDISVAPHIMMDGQWEPDVSRAMLRILKPGMKVLDLGANTGYYSLMFARYVGRDGSVDAFEANPTLAALVNRSLTVNGFTSFAKCHSMAVADKPGELVLQQLSHHLGSSSIVAVAATAALHEEMTSYTVQATSLDTFFPDTAFDFIKIDCEGAEPLIIEGAKDVLTRKENMHLFFEYLPGAPGKEDRIFAPLVEMGYKFSRIETDGTLSPLDYKSVIADRKWAEVYARRGND